MEKEINIRIIIRNILFARMKGFNMAWPVSTKGFKCKTLNILKLKYPQERCWIPPPA